MTGALLRTGSLDVFHPLGAEGNPVHAAAAQIRAAIARRLGREVADTFAIPQRNEDGDTIDWYAPTAGSVIPWSAASEAERAAAKQRLEEVRARVDGLGQQMAEDPDPQRQVFARLLQHVCTFPSEEHVYLVEERPVISFWGFRHHNRPAYTGEMLNLDALRADRSARRAIPWWWWLIGALALGLLAFLLLRGCAEEPASTPPDLEPGLQRSEPDAAETPELPLEPPVIDRPPPGATDPTGVERRVTLPPAAALADRIDGRIDRDTVLLSDGGSVEVGDAAVVEAQQTRLLEDAAPAVESGGAVDDAELTDTSRGGEAEAILTDSPGTDVSEALPPSESVDPSPTVPDPGPDLGAGLDEDAARGLDLQADLAGPEGAQQAEDAPVEGVSEGVPRALEEESGTPVDMSGASGLQQTGPDTGRDVPDVPAESNATDADGGALTAAKQGTDERPGPTGETPREPGGAGAPRAGPGGALPGLADGQRLPPMIIPGDAQRTGSVRFADGGWRSWTSLQDTRGLPVQIGYRLADGAGRVELRRHDGVVCAADVQAQMRRGNLVIDSVSDITCPDGANFGRPSLECTPGDDGRADCSGRYRTGERFSVDLGKLPVPEPDQSRPTP